MTRIMPGLSSKIMPGFSSWSLIGESVLANVEEAKIEVVAVPNFFQYIHTHTWRMFIIFILTYDIFLLKQKYLH